MANLTRIPRLAYLTTALAAGALIVSANIANPKGDHHHQGNNTQSNGVRPHFVISGQPANVKRVLSSTKRKQTAKKKKGCGNIIVPTAEYGNNPKNPVGSTGPTLPPQASGGKPVPKGPSPEFTTVKLSNGVTTSAIFNGKGLTVTSNSPGTITVFNGRSSVTLAGGSLNLSGATSVQAGAGMQLVRHPNGDVTVAANPTATAPVNPTAGANNGPPGVTPTDNLKELGKVAGNGAATVRATIVGTVAGVGLTIGALEYGIASGHPIKATKEIAEEVWSDVADTIKWAGGWF
jgi:hypothetical protein